LSDAANCAAADPAPRELLHLNTKFRREDEGLFISIALRGTAGKKRNIADISGVEFRLQQERTNAENIDYSFDRAAHDRGVCAGHREIPGFLGSRPGTEDAEERDGGGTGQDEEEQDGGGTGQDAEEQSFGRAGGVGADDDRIGRDQKEVLVI
jgi:hypothetical protein